MKLAIISELILVAFLKTFGLAVYAQSMREKKRKEDRKPVRAIVSRICLVVYPFVYGPILTSVCLV